MAGGPSVIPGRWMIVDFILDPAYTKEELKAAHYGICLLKKNIIFK
jgi:hypothetical protein